MGKCGEDEEEHSRKEEDCHHSVDFFYLLSTRQCSSSADDLCCVGFELLRCSLLPPLPIIASSSWMGAMNDIAHESTFMNAMSFV